MNQPSSMAGIVYIMATVFAAIVLYLDQVVGGIAFAVVQVIAVAVILNKVCVTKAYLASIAANLHALRERQTASMSRTEEGGAGGSIADVVARLNKS